ncbi:MAG TPA: MarR family winged helix-turn-helix transcriptional regulator [Solirubrobacterales bacterium]|jgi:DNA-binding MarR family transcriptional regulator|nr:MarR family winged helix-turn-helix transcriptional regulator [Solirubrobacterales bacterium]
MSVKPETDDRIPLPPLLENAREAGFEELHRRLAERGYADIRHAHGCVFRWVDPEGTRLTELAELAGHSKQAVGEFVCDLEARGYVERVPDPADGRAKIIRLTERGAEAKATALEIFAEIEAEWAERIGPERVEALREALEVLYELERSVPVPA